MPDIIENTATVRLEKRKVTGGKWLDFNKYTLIGAFLIASALGVSVVISQLGITYGILIIALAIAVPLLIYSSSNPGAGLFLVFFLSFFLQEMSKHMSIPVGLMIDFLLLYYFLVMVIHIGRKGSWAFAKNSVGFVILIWIIYNIAEVANPVASSRLAWVYTIRGMAGAMVFFYICSYNFKNFTIVSNFINVWIFLTLLLALYGLYQEFHGLSSAELAWIKSDKVRYGLFYNWGRFRKFSFFSDPTSFGMAVAYTAVLCLVLSLGSTGVIKRIYYLSSAGIMALAMVFSGTRTAYVLIPVGIMFFTVLTLKRSFIVFSIVFFVLGAGVILSPIKSLGPIDNNALERLRSAFLPDSDPSFQVRLKNQAFIKPYIIAHPIGAGLGSIGAWGQRFSPHTALANFPPDSGFVKIAVELGWIGLILYSVMLFIVMKTGIKNYHLIIDPTIKNMQAALLSVLFCLIIANYAQEAITMYPTSIIYYAAMAMVTIMPKLESKHN